MTSKKSDLLKLILIILIIVVFLALFILVFSWICYILPIDFPGTIGDWITALSSLAGGALTLCGVRWTIIHSNEQKIEELSIQFKPYLKFNNAPVAIQDDDIFIEMGNNDYLPMSIELKNIGRGEANISSIEIRPIDDLPKSMITIKYILSEEHIIKDEITKLDLKIYSNKLYSIVSDKIKIKDEIIVNYTDLYKKNMYQKNFELIFQNITYTPSPDPFHPDSYYNNEILETYVIEIK